MIHNEIVWKNALYSKLVNMLWNWNKRDETPKLTSWAWLSSSNTNFDIIHTINSRCWCKVMELGRGIHVLQIVFWISNNIISCIRLLRTELENRKAKWIYILEPNLMPNKTKWESYKSPIKVNDCINWCRSQYTSKPRRQPAKWNQRSLKT
jgi:hypothetical protein